MRAMICPMLAMLLAATVTTTLIAADPPAAQQAASVGVLNVFRFMENSKYMEKLQGPLRTKSAEMQKGLKTLDADLKNRTSARDGVPQDSPEYVRMTEDIEVIKVQLQYRHDASLSFLQGENAQLIKQGYRMLRALLADYAKERHLAMVFQAATDDILGGRPGEMGMQISAAVLLYSPEAYDITDDFLAYADKRTTEGKMPVLAEPAAANSELPQPIPATPNNSQVSIIPAPAPAPKPTTP